MPNTSAPASDAATIHAPRRGRQRNTPRPATGPTTITRTMNALAAGVIGIFAEAWAAPWTSVTTKWPSTAVQSASRAVARVSIRYQDERVRLDVPTGTG